MNEIIIFCAQYLPLAIIFALGVAWLKQPKSIKLQLLIAIVFAGIISVIFSRIASKLYYHPRPFAVEHVKPLIDHSADNGFPSDHALLTGTLTAITFFFSKRIAVAMAIMTLLVGSARVLAKIHSPLDIIGGWTIGLVGAAVSYTVIMWSWSHYRTTDEA